MNSAERYGRVELQRQLDQKLGRMQAMLGGWQTAAADALALVGELYGGSEMVIGRHVQSAGYHARMAQTIIQTTINREKDDV